MLVIMCSVALPAEKSSIILGQCVFMKIYLDSTKHPTDCKQGTFQVIYYKANVVKFHAFIRTQYDREMHS